VPESSKRPPVDDLVRIKDDYYIRVTSSRIAERTLVLKHGETFAVFDHYGDLVPFGLGEQGLYHEGTRFLSRLDLRLGEARPLLLSSTVREDNDVITVDLTNPDLTVNGRLVPRGRVHIFRAKFLFRGVCYERLRVTNFGLEVAELPLAMRFDADFADIFEVRGLKRARRGQRLPDRLVEGAAVLAYRGLDEVLRQTRIECWPPPARLDPREARFVLRLEPQASITLYVTVSCHVNEPLEPPEPYDQAFADFGRELAAARSRQCRVFTSNEQFNDWIGRSTADLAMMITETPVGPYPYAGIPWFSTAFGRDGIITALELLWADPRIARGVLAYLAETQATAIVDAQDAQPGKILHETRRGEMATLGEVPFGRYYGSVDATPLFVVLAGAYYERTADRSLIEAIWPHLDRALTWIDTFGDADGDGFVEYSRRSPRGLVHQGWKDSEDAIFHADGRLAQPPIALCEVQGYVYAARQAGARLARVLGHETRAAQLLAQAERLRQAFETQFWLEELGTYALALDGHKRPCRVRTSNAGQCLFTGIVSPDRARRVAEVLLSESSYSGWGIRTVDARELRYNPMAYHNGSVWPHDNALIALGLARYGLTPLALRLLKGLFDASLFVDLHRLPELFCGFARRPGEGPTLYPLACTPQAWAAGAVFMLLEAALGMKIQAEQRRVLFMHPLLPEFFEWVKVSGLQVADFSVDLLLERHDHDVGVRVLRRDGPVEIVVVK
jgi:glycogen debranching enzyme